MGKGFFRQEQIASNRNFNTPNHAQCGKCKLKDTCMSPKMPPTGNFKVPLYQIAEAPGGWEDQKNEQLVGDSGQFHRRVMRRLGFHIDDGLKDNANRCRPPENKKPTKTQMQHCRPNIRETINKYKPHVIIAMGEMAVKSLIDHKFDGDIGEIGKWQGAIIPDQEYKAWICPTFHPSYVIRDTSPKAVEKIYEENLKHALQMLDIPLPYYVFENEEDKIEILKHPKEINKFMKKLVHFHDVRLTAFDYETSGLKPHKEGHKIKTCSISWGPDHAVAFPIIKSPDFHKLFARYLASTDIMKMAADLKYEKNWSETVLGMNINGWKFDTQLGAHVLDNRPKITSLEYQNYVTFGQEPYDGSVKKYIKPNKNPGGNDFNYIDQADLRELLLYNGMDSMTEFRLGIVMMARMGIEYQHLFNEVSAEELAPQYFEILEKGSADDGQKKKSVSGQQGESSKKTARKTKRKKDGTAISRSKKR